MHNEHEARAFDGELGAEVVEGRQACAVLLEAEGEVPCVYELEARRDEEADLLCHEPRENLGRVGRACSEALEGERGEWGRVVEWCLALGGEVGVGGGVVGGLCRVGGFGRCGWVGGEAAEDAGDGVADRVGEVGCGRGGWCVV